MAKKKVDRKFEREKSFVQGLSQGFTGDEIGEALDLEDSIERYLQREELRPFTAALAAALNLPAHYLVGE